MYRWLAFFHAAVKRRLIDKQHNHSDKYEICSTIRSRTNIVSNGTRYVHTCAASFRENEPTTRYYHGIVLKIAGNWQRTNIFLVLIIAALMCSGRRGHSSVGTDDLLYVLNYSHSSSITNERLILIKMHR